MNTESFALTFVGNSPDSYELFFKELENTAGDIKVWLLDGAMGAGKTTFVRMYGQYKKFIEPVSSPTFSIVNEYRNNDGDIFYHFDFYRIKNEREAFEIGVEDYFYSDNICLVEWGSLIPSLLPETYVKINFEILSEQSRQLNVTIVKSNY
jgi:tRNA threonylcarbamoyladenosine biosynthesis protein TsaE